MYTSKSDETLERKMLQKKLNRKKFLTEDLNKLLVMSEIERQKNEIPGAYVSLSFTIKAAMYLTVTKRNNHIKITYRNHYYFNSFWENIIIYINAIDFLYFYI